MKNIGSIIKSRREELSLSASALTASVGADESAILAWENGKACPSARQIVSLAVSLNISPDSMMCFEANAESMSYGAEDRKCVSPECYAADEEISVASEGTAFVSPYIFGENLEHTRSDVFHGISAQLLFNRKFAGKPQRYNGCELGWYPIGTKAFFSEDSAYTRHCENYRMHRALERNAQNIVNLEGGVPAGIGQHEIMLTAGKEYEFRAVVKTPYTLTLTVALTSRHGGTVYASHSFDVTPCDWTTLTAILTPDTTDADADIRIYFTEEVSATIGSLSLMPADNFRGMRRDVIDRLREMGIGILRWPGGNFAGEYCWEDGLMPCDMRAPFESYLHLETQPHSMCYDYHEIAIDDFVLLCREIGAEPFVTINPIWSTPEDDAHFVEYCNGGADTEYGAKRAERGFTEPFNVKFWSLGNEMGYGHMEGDKTPGGYARIAESNADAMLAVDPNLTLCSSGPYPNKNWADNSANALKGKAALVSMHHYSPYPNYRNADKLRDEYYCCLGDIENMRMDLRRMHSELGDGLKVSFDEWNNWYAWYHQSYIYNGIYSALVLHMFMAEADAASLGVVCHFEAVNEGMIEVYENTSRLTAAGQMFSVMSKHAGGEIVYMSRFAVITRKDGKYTATLINASYDSDKKFTLPAIAANASGTLYYAADMKPVSFFEERPVAMTSSEAVVPAHSVLMLQF